MSQKDNPELDEFVIATVRKILPYGAFCTLDEYDDREAFIHISEVASRWIKNIHEFLKEDQKVVAKVFRMVPEKNQIDLSLKRVSDIEKRRKIESDRKDKRALKLFEVVEGRIGKPHDEVWKGMGEALVEKFGDLYSALEESVINDTALDSIKAPNEWKVVFKEVAVQNIKKPKVRVTGNLSISCRAPDGVEVIKRILLDATENLGEEGEARITYLGAPRYMVVVSAPDYKKAERISSTIFKRVKDGMKGKESCVAFEKEEK
ncbi:MAG: translation initiation factor IF-2 subunit alpha [Candidatus Micrarchaeota archaeon]|nr:translation initiation factor IF-2 subunit alpha [Candidatus Micrarchaeota archaeon]